MSGAATSWIEANQRLMVRSIQRVAALLARARGEAEAPARLEVAEREIEAARAAMPGPAAIDHVQRLFGLSSFERDVLLLCAGVELDAAFAAEVALAGRGEPTFGRALASLPEPHWDALSPGAPLRWWRLVDVDTSASLCASTIRINERILHFLVGAPALDPLLEAMLTPQLPQAAISAGGEALVEAAAERWRHAGSTPLGLHGVDVSQRAAVAGAIAARLGLRLSVLRASDIPAAPSERATLQRLWEREALLSSSALLIEIDDDEALARQPGALSLLESLLGPVMLSSREPMALARRPILRLEVPPLSPAEQRALWTGALGPLADAMPEGVAAVANSFRLGPQDVLAVAARVRARAAEQPERAADELWGACREQARGRLDQLAQHVRTSATWADLVLPDAARQLLQEMLGHVRHQLLVYETWGFGRQTSRGLGVTAMFHGPSGTGKTLAAEVLANELGLDLYRIDLSSVVSKYIGETEKNLRRVFDAAEHGGAILLFDEADALFGRRGEVKDSHDRYANIEVSYLLQRMEAYRGLAILTTNLKENLDSAFLRRIRFVVPFPFPAREQREQIWRRCFPGGAPSRELDPARLSRLNLAGGNIRNIALHAAFLAADERAPIQMRHLLRAARVECNKLEQPLSAADIGGWV